MKHSDSIKEVINGAIRHGREADMEPRPRSLSDIALAAVAVSEDLQLTPKQMRVYELLLFGLQNKHIAERMNISESMVKTHVTSILRKTETSNRTEAVIFSLRRAFKRARNESLEQAQFRSNP